MSPSHAISHAHRISVLPETPSRRLVFLNAMARLPPELTDLIISFLSGDPGALQACSLVCRDWLPASRHHLFARGITLDPRNTRTRALIDLLTAPLSTIAGYVHTARISAWHTTIIQPFSTIARPLELICVETLIVRGRSFVQEWERERLSVWFANVTTLNLRADEFDGPDEFYSFLSLFRSLRMLNLRGTPKFAGMECDDERTLPSSLRIINIYSDESLRLSWLFPPAKSSADLDLASN
jgi:hypothetical protein